MAVQTDQVNVLKLLFLKELANIDQVKSFLLVCFILLRNLLFLKASLGSSLAISCIHGSYESFMFLYENFFSRQENKEWLNAKNIMGDSALTIAIQSHIKIDNKYIDNFIIIMKMLQNEFIEKKVKNNHGNTSIHLVCQNHYFNLDVSFLFLIY